MAEEKGFGVTTLFRSDTLHTWNEVKPLILLIGRIESGVGRRKIYATSIALLGDEW
ncbi:MAG: hypothetical protein ACLU4J_02735 [Butyricimonas paravirosa]